MNHNTPKPIRISTADNINLGGTLYKSENSDSTLIVNGATAVPHQFYRRFAEFIRDKGWNVLCYDFRGTGESAPDNLVGYEAKASDWGLYDIPAALNWVRSHLSPQNIYFIGHSAGGQQAGLLEDVSDINAMLTVSAQSGYWKLQGNNEKIKVLMSASLIIPVLCRVYGYFPWSKLANSEDLAKGVALQWARWCRSSGYILDDKSLPLDRYQEFRAPILAYSIDDDDWGTAPSVDAMMQAYPKVERQHLVPQALGLKKLGHMGYFRKGSEALWQTAFEWLAQYSNASSS